MVYRFICPKQRSLFSAHLEDAQKYAELWLKCGEELLAKWHQQQAIRQLGYSFETSWILANSNYSVAARGIELLPQAACALSGALARSKSIRESQSIIALATKRVSRELETLHRRSAIRGLARLCSFTPIQETVQEPKMIARVLH